MSPPLLISISPLILLLHACDTSSTHQTFYWLRLLRLPPAYQGPFCDTSFTSQLLNFFSLFKSLHLALFIRSSSSYSGYFSCSSFRTPPAYQGPFNTSSTFPSVFPFPPPSLVASLKTPPAYQGPSSTSSTLQQPPPAYRVTPLPLPMSRSSSFLLLQFTLFAPLVRLDSLYLLMAAYSGLFMSLVAQHFQSALSKLLPLSITPLPPLLIRVK